MQESYTCYAVKLHKQRSKTTPTSRSIYRYKPVVIVKRMWITVNQSIYGFKKESQEYEKKSFKTCHE